MRLKTVIYEIVANVTPEEEISLKSLVTAIGNKYPDCIIEEYSVPNEPQPTKAEWISQNIKWENARGPYERANSQDSQDFKLLVKELEEHGGQMQKGGFFYWKFHRSETVGRRRLSDERI